MSTIPREEEHSEDVQGGPSRSLCPLGQLLLFSHLTHPRTLPNMCGTEFYQDGFHHTGRWGGAPPTVRVQTGRFSLTSGAGTLSLPLALSLEPLGKNKASILFHLTNTSCPAQRPIPLLPPSEKKKEGEYLGLY